MKHLLLLLLPILFTSCSTGGGNSGGGTSAPIYPWPESQGTVKVNDPIIVTGTYDGKMKTHDGAGLAGNCGQAENMEPMFVLKSGAILKNVIIKEAPDGIHVEGNNVKIQKVYMRDVCEDAVTISGDNTLIEDCAWEGAADKIVQVNRGKNSQIIKNWMKIFKSGVRVKKGAYVALVKNCTFIDGSGAVVLDSGVKAPKMEDNGFYNVKYEVRK